MSGGRSRLRGKNAEATIACNVEKLANHALLTGFQTPGWAARIEKLSVQP